MSEPRLTADELWPGICSLCERGETIYSLRDRRRHTICALEEHPRRYRIKYASGNHVWVSLQRLYNVYRELYRVGQLCGSDFSDDPDYCERVLGKRTWHAPGRAIFAVLPLLDSNIGNRDAVVYVRTPE